jgi:tRNA (mo5U34)-methyltransferase
MFGDPMGSIQPAANAFQERLEEIRKNNSLPNGQPWYPYRTAENNIAALDQVLRGEDRTLFSNLRGKTVADIGAADGDMGFFLDTFGAEVDLIDHPATNMNGFEGAKLLKSKLHSSASLHAVDLDSQFRLPRPRYDLAIFLGILYHLKNPFYALEHLAWSAKLALLSTKITAYAVRGGTRLAGIPAAYLLAADECNNDPTCFWVFTEAGLRRLLHRTGWDVINYKVIGGSIETSDPYSQQGDRRAFCLIRSNVLP